MMFKRVFVLKEFGPVMLAGVCLGVSLLHPLLWPLVFLGGVLAVRSISEAATTTRAAMYGFVIGVVKSAIAISWFFATYPLDWLGVSSLVTQIVLICLYWIPGALTLGSGMALMGYLYRRFVHQRSAVWIDALCVAVLWVLAEVVGALVFSVYTIGPGSSINANFSFGHTGYALVPHHLFFLAASVLGVYSLSFVVGGMSLLLYRAHAMKWRWRHVFVLCIFFSSVVPLLSMDSTDVDESVALIGTSFPAVAESERVPWKSRYRVAQNALRAASDTASGYVVFPEDVRFTDSIGSATATLAYLEQLSDTPRIYFDSARLDTEGQTVLRAYVYDTQNGEVYTFDKQYLVPQGEYIPYVYATFIKMIEGDNETVQQARTERVYEPGVSQDSVGLPARIPPVLFCFESVAPFGVRTAIGDRTQAPFVAHIVSHAWFRRDPQILWNQLDSMLLVQARFSGKPIVQAANEAPLKVYYPSGQIEYPDILHTQPQWSIGVTQL